MIVYSTHASLTVHLCTFPFIIQGFMSKNELSFVFCFKFCFLWAGETLGGFGISPLLQGERRQGSQGTVMIKPAQIQQKH